MAGAGIVNSRPESNGKKRKTVYLIIIVIILTAIISGCAKGETDIDPIGMAQRTNAPGAETEPSGGSEKLEKIMNYTADELNEIDKYVERSKGAKLTLHRSKSDEQSLFTRIVQDIGEIPDNSRLKLTNYVRYSTYIAFSETGNQNLTVKGADDAEIIIHYNELHSGRYTAETVFKKNVFYKIDVGFSYSPGMTPEFQADSEYKLSQNAPSFGGIPEKPVKAIADIHLRDAFILTGADGKYYMTGTYDPVDWANTKEIHVYRSDDLAAWTDLGAVWNYQRDADWQKEMIKDGSSPIWAPELHYIGGNYYICYSMGWGAMNGSILRSRTGAPEGPYEDICKRPVFDYIDSTFFVDSDGAVYAIWSDGIIARMSDDMTKLASSPKALVSESGLRVGFEGCFLFKINGLYYLCSATYAIHYREDGSAYQSYDSFYAVSDKLEGPYSERRLLLINGGHNNIFRANDGKLYTTAFYGNDFAERPAIAEIEVTEDGLLKLRS
ncbi:MAG: family 43 glycosylhydrolase [Clostridia bacterium]|nr:family 43 glycosylhydrolase [Clostridia bacterium]